MTCRQAQDVFDFVMEGFKLATDGKVSAQVLADHDSDMLWMRLGAKGEAGTYMVAADQCWYCMKVLVLRK